MENCTASIECTFLKSRKVEIWSMKMIFIPCINIVYRRICIKNFLIKDNADN